MAASGTGPLYFAWRFEGAGSYSGVFFLLGSLALAAGVSALVLVSFLKQPRKKRREKKEEDDDDRDRCVRDVVDRVELTLQVLEGAFGSLHLIAERTFLFGEPVCRGMGFVHSQISARLAAALCELRRERHSRTLHSYRRT